VERKIKRRSWKLGRLELGLVTTEDAQEAPEAFRHEPGTEAASGRPTPEAPGAPPSRGRPRALWNRPLWQQLLAIPALVVVLTLRIWGFQTWWWIVLAIAVPTMVVYILAGQRIPPG
jgi:hypothetical protein